MKVLLYQPIIAPYQVPFFDRLACYDQVHSYTIRYSRSIGSQRGVSGDFLRKRYAFNHNIEFIEVETIECGPLCLSLINPLTFVKDRRDYDVVIVGTNPYHIHGLISAFTAKHFVTWGQYRVGKNCYSRLIYGWLKARSKLDIIYDENELPYISPGGRVKAIPINNAIEYGRLEKRLILSKQVSPSLLFIGRITDKSGLYGLPSVLGRMLSSGILPKRLKVGIIGGSETDYRRLIAIAERHYVSSYFKYHGEVRESDEISRISLDYCFGLYPGHIGLSAYTLLGNGLPVVTFKSYDENVSMPESLCLTSRNSFTPLEGDSGASVLMNVFRLSQSSYDEMVRECIAIRDVRNIDSMVRRFVGVINRLQC